MATRPVIAFEGVQKSYDGGSVVLRDVNLSVARGEFLFVTGQSGAGKSTLLKLINREETADAGRVLFNGRDLARLTRRSVQVVRRNIGVVFQDFRLVPYWSAAQNVAVALEVLGLSVATTRARVLQALRRVGLDGRESDLACVLSGGEQQRVALARAIVNEPVLVVADEPTGNLDPLCALDMLGLFEEINRAGTTVVFATHDCGLLDMASHRLVALDKGRCIETRSGLHDLGDVVKTQLAWCAPVGA